MYIDFVPVRRRVRRADSGVTAGAHFLSAFACFAHRTTYYHLLFFRSYSTCRLSFVSIVACVPTLPFDITAHPSTMEHSSFASLH
jgi:hypothetical protein